MTETLTDAERRFLLRLARESIERAARGKPQPTLDHSALTPALLADGASFVTLTIHGQLRGCIGALEAYQPLADDVREHAIAAATQDPRFPPLDEAELRLIQIEVSRLTAPQPFPYASAEDLLARLIPGEHGVILQSGFRRATFLPQVWTQLPDPQDFLDHLCMKMGAPKDIWRQRDLQVSVYRVEEFDESHYHQPNA